MLELLEKRSFFKILNVGNTELKYWKYEIQYILNLDTIYFELNIYRLTAGFYVDFSYVCKRVEFF